MGRRRGMPDGDEQVSPDEERLASGLHAHRGAAVRHHPSPHAAGVHSSAAVHRVHPRARAGRARFVRDAVYMAGEARACGPASRESRDRPAAVRVDIDCRALSQRRDERPPADRRARADLRRLHPRDHHRRRQQHRSHRRDRPGGDAGGAARQARSPQSSQRRRPRAAGRLRRGDGPLHPDDGFRFRAAGAGAARFVRVRGRGTRRRDRQPVLVRVGPDQLPVLQDPLQPRVPLAGEAHAAAAACATCRTT